MARAHVLQLMGNIEDVTQPATGEFALGSIANDGAVNCAEYQHDCPSSRNGVSINT